MLKDSRNRDVKFDFGDFFKITFYRELTTQTKTGGINGGINQIFEFIKNNPNAKVKEIQMSLKYSKRTTERHLKILKEKGLIEFKGSLKTGGYFLKS